MDKNLRIAYLKSRIELLKARGRDNGNIIRKLERELRRIEVA